MPRCPICAKDVAPRSKNNAFPFCTTRCKQVDLGKWLNEEYRIPTETSQDDDASPKANVGQKGEA